jgi:hypothetical protein
MSISGPVGGFQPVSPDEFARISSESSSLVENLRDISNRPGRFDADVNATFGRYGSWVRNWIKSFLSDHPRTLDRVDDWGNGLKKLADTALADGTVTPDEAKALVDEASDYGQMSSDEKQFLTSMLTGSPAKFDPVARQALSELLQVSNPLPVQSTDGTTPTDGTSGTTATTATEPWMPPGEVLSKHGLNVNGPETASTYEGDNWGNVGYYPYSGSSGQYTSFSKFQNVFGSGAEDGHSWFENYGDPPTGLSRGSHILSGTISEANFEETAGVDLSQSRKINNAAYEAVREAGGKSDAEYALFDMAGEPLPFGEGDALVPMKHDGSAWVSADAGDRDVTFRIKRADGTIDQDGHAESLKETIGAESGVEFDLLDATGRLVSYNPRWGDRMAESFKDDSGTWHALAKNGDGTFDHKTFGADGSVASSGTVDKAGRDALVSGKDTMYRVLGYDDKLRGDGDTSGTYNMSWWGKCHNVAALSTSDLARPEEPFGVVTNLEAGETLAVQLGNDTLIRNDDGGYTRQARSGSGAVTGTSTLTAAEAEALPGFADAGAVIVRPDGSLKDAEFQMFNPTDVDALTSHIGNSATVSKGFEGQRYYAAPDEIRLKDGSVVTAHIKEVKTAGGDDITIGRRSGHEFKVQDRSALRAPGLKSFSETDPRYRRTYARNEISMADLNAHRTDDLAQLVVVEPDGTERTIDAADVESMKWENRLDFSPDLLWKLHGTVTGDNSTVTETFADTQVWNYATRDVNTESIDPATLSSDLKASAELPGMKTGSVGADDRYYFRTRVETEGGDADLTYWVTFDDAGNVEDYRYLGDASDVSGAVPDFTWTSHVKDPYDSTWGGESQAPGISNEQIRRVYLASQGAFRDHMAGRFISTHDLENASEARPQ